MILADLLNHLGHSPVDIIGDATVSECPAGVVNEEIDTNEYSVGKIYPILRTNKNGLRYCVNIIEVEHVSNTTN